MFAQVPISAFLLNWDVRPLRPPPPEIIWPSTIQTFERAFAPPSGPVIQSNSEKDCLHSYHDYSLHEQRSIVSCSRPVEYLQDRCREHDQWDIEREARRGPRAVDGKDLIGVGGNGGQDKAVCRRR